MVRAPRLLLLALALFPGCKKNEPPPPPPTVAEAPAPPPNPSAATASKSSEAFEVVLTVAGPVTKDEKATVGLGLQAKPPFHVNPEFPLNFKPATVVNGVRFDRVKFELLESATRQPCEGGGKDACALSAEVPFTVDAQGPRRVEGVFAFSVCDKERCLIEKALLGMDVVAQ